MTSVVSRPELGDLCHFRPNNAVPVAVLTDLKSNIICANEPKDKDGNLQWFVSGCRVMITRFWSTNTGFVNLSCEASNEKLPLFPLDKLGIEREVCIWLGYIPTIRPVIPEDLGTHLLRIFVGKVDIVQSTSTGVGGFTTSLQLRDRVSWLTDTIVSYNPALDPKVGEEPLRSNLILEVSQRGIGQVDSDAGCTVCGKQIKLNPDFYYDLGDFEKFGIERSAPIEPVNTSSADGRLAGTGGTGQPTQGLKSGLLSRFPPLIAAAFYGNLMQESGGRTQPYPPNPLGAVGLVQWLYERKTAILALAQSRGVSVYDINLQLDFIVLELNGSESAAYSRIKQAAATGSLEAVTRMIRVAYERPGEGEANDANRIRNAQQFYSEIKQGTVPATPTPPVAPTPAPATPSTDTPVRDDEKIIEVSEIPPANAWYVGDGKTPGPLAATTTTTRFTVDEFPDFRIFTTRAPINLQNNTNFLINQEVPVTILNFLAMQEVYPTELFQDHRDGHLYYCPRANDSTGIDDSKRFLRTYFFRNYPDSYIPNIGKLDACPPDVNQMLLSFREEQASLDLKTNFIVSKSAANAEGGSGDDWSIHLKVKPHVLEGIKYPCKFFKVLDETITSLEEAAVVALSISRIMGKEVRAGTTTMLGDPSFVPGEIIQVFGSPLLPNLGMTNGYKDRETYKQFEGRYNDNIKIYATESLKNAGVSGRGIEKDQEVTLPNYDGSDTTVKVGEFSQESMDSLICETGSFSNSYVGEDSSKFKSTNPTDTTSDTPAATPPAAPSPAPTSGVDFNSSDNAKEDASKDAAEDKANAQAPDEPITVESDPPTIWRVEAILHKMNISGSGYTTELSLTNPF